MSPILYVGPTSVGGEVMRLVGDGTIVWSEVWAGPAVGWVPRGEVRDCLVNPPASRERLVAFGIPPSDWGPGLFDSVGD